MRTITRQHNNPDRSLKPLPFSLISGQNPKRKACRSLVVCWLCKMQIKDLPFRVIFQLCRHLDSPHADRFSWRALLSHVPRKSSNSLSSKIPSLPLSLFLLDSPYNAIDVGAFQRVGHQPNGSPTEAVLQDFIARGFSVDDLYLMMKDMGYVEGMRILQQYGELVKLYTIQLRLPRNKYYSYL